MVRRKFIQFTKNFVKNNKKEIIAIIAIILIVVFILYALYFEFAKYPVPRSFTTRPDVEPKDWLTFWGSFLSFIGTIFLGVIVFIQNERLNNKNRELEQNKFNQENCSVIRPHNICAISLSNVTERVVHHMSWALNNKNIFDFVSLAQRDNKVTNMHEHIINNKDDYICLSIIIYFKNDRRHIA